ncbi:cilia- and flagella-associated protein 54 isoform X1 [Corvus moneduloides]|uniref:cilia- and flagella-associated protein 54 isoform X1 n=1 Tax=Corvus moneduloides TaxID=1196302 RepID=UPI0013637035|nr:cilia- and flagella-associated protein 54 isoform X1 [Corvus moneduloides]
MAEPTRPPPAAGPQAPHAAFFGPVARGNPVVDSFEAELRRVLGSLRRLRGAGEAKPPQHDLHRHGANTLFNIWIKYKPRLPEWYYNERLVKVGDALAQIKEYKLALLQCYERYLQQFVSVNLDDVMDDAHRFKSAFFPNGFRDKNAALTFHALQARNVCIYQMVFSSDRNLQNQESLQTCLSVLTSLRLTMQVALPQENLCWLIYNGAIHIYTICRRLMMMGQSAKVLEYLLWASVCMESSIPLLSVHYLTWRATLYTAVSQCYFDCQAGIHGEIFARRGLIKIDELRRLENTSSSLENTETQKIFREATLKMSVMIFKRAVYESRRKSNTRRESKLNPRKAVDLSWPRTSTERLLVEMFDGAAAQFLAILEALSDSSRSLLPPHPPVPDEIAIRDVTSELFSAGLEILSGGESSGTKHFGIINPSSTLLQLMLTGEKGVSGDAAVKFVKLAFSYEEWDVFYSALEFVDNFLQAQDDPTWKKAEIELKLLTLMQPVVFPGKFECCFSVIDDSSKEGSTPQGSEKTQTIRKQSLKHGDPFHDLVILATTVLSCISTSEQNVHPDKEILVDVVMCLWQKCKMELQQIQASGSDCLEYIHKHEAYQWVHILWIINEIMEKSNIADTNVMFAEITLCLAAILENVADSTSESKEKEGGSASLLQDETCDMPEILMKTPTEQLQIAYEILEKAINDMNTSWLMTLSRDGKSIFDNCSRKVDSNDQNLNSVLRCGDDKTGTDNGFVTDLHLELIQAQHRVAVKLLKITQGAQVVDRSLKSSKFQEKNIGAFQYLSEELIMKKIKRNKLSRAIFLMQKAAQKFPEELTATSQRQLLEEALTLIEQVEAEQSALYRSLKEAMSSRKKSRTPPPPLLLSRSHCSMTFKPAPFDSYIQVSWYCILGSVAGGSNTKVRLNSNKLQNSGEEIPADGKSLLEVQGLDANEKYVFAVAAYSSDGKLIGDAVGQMTKPILAYPPLSATTVRAYLTQVAYQTGNFRLARAAFSPMWDYFVSNSSPLPPNEAVISASSNLTISEKRLRFEAVSQTSPITLHLFLRNMFAVSDINIMEGALFCDSICSNEIFYKEQVARLSECERMAVAIELSNWLNDASYSLQSVVQCYGLLAPLIYHKIFLVPVVQILIKCLAVLQEIPSATLQSRQEGCYESIQHMIACISYHTAKVLHSWKEYELAVIIINYGKKLLISPTVSLSLSGDVKTKEAHTGKEKCSSRASHLAAVAKATENLSTLETSLLKLTEPGPGTQLTGQESPLFLYPVISCWTSERAYREVLKFRGQSRFLEFFVQLLHKVLNEEKFQCVLEWADSVEVYLKRRNEDFLGTDGIATQARSFTQRDGTRAAGVQKGKDTSPSKKPKASPAKKPKKKALPKKGPLREYLLKNPDIMNSPEKQGKGKDKLKKLAHQTLVMLLRKYVTRSQFCHMCLEEMPWKSQMNVYLAVAHYHLFKKNLEELYNVGISGSQHLDSYNVLDPEIFSLNNSGTVLAREAVEDNLRKPTPSLLEKTETTKNQSFTDKSPQNRIKRSRTPRSPTTKDTKVSISQTPEEQDQFPSITLLLKHFTSIFLHLKRAVVLAHRGSHWTLLQNACRELWNYTQEFQWIANQSHSHMDEFPITWDFLRNTIWLPFYFASDMIIDMIIDLQASSSLKIVDPEGDFCIPSCLGGIMDENGGSNLHPQPPLDDVNMVDMRWICNLILKTVELLYQMKKWEALVHIAIQFNIFTHERYTEQVSPLLVYAQRQLLERMQQFSGPDSRESHFTKHLADAAQKMSCRNYIGYKLRLPVAHSASEGVFPGYFFSPETNNDSTDDNQAKALVCVPLDVNDTLRCFRETLEKSKYHSRALRHSRKLLSLFLAHTQENAGRAISSHSSSSRKLKFNVGGEVIFLPAPCDLSQEKYNFSSMVESRPMPKSQLSVIISSYEQTIGILEMNNQRDLKVQALHELGNLHFYAGSKRDAFKYWCQALDETLNITDALHTWQELGFPKDATDCFAVGRSTDMSQKLLSQAGAWGCLHAAVLVAKIAQYITTSQMRLRTKYCYFSAILFKTLFRASLPHPTTDYDFVQYETNILIPGIDLFSDRYRADISTVVASLNFIMFELHCAKQNLIILPLFTLYQYIVSEICKDPARCIEGRIFKIKVLTDIGFFTEAFHELSLLIWGERIPWKIPAGYRYIEQMQALQKFDSSKSLMTVTNLQVLEDTFNWSLSLTVVPLCNQRIMNKLTLAKMHLIICLSATINNIPEKVEKKVYSVDNSLPEPNKAAASNVKVDADQNSRQQEQRDTIVHLVDCKDELNMAMLKGILLTEAEESLSYLVQDIQEKYDGDISWYSVEDLEALIEAKLELASISQQRHQAALSVALAFSAIRLLQDAKVFSMDVTHFHEEKDERECLDSNTEGVQLPPSVTAQEHMNARLWLRCRAMLVTALLTQIQGVGDVKGNDVAERRSVIKEVILEAEAFGDIETQAEMMVQVAILDLQEKRPVADIKLLLQNIIGLLQEDTFISLPASLTLVKSMLLLADILPLEIVEDTEHCSSAVEPLNLLVLAHELTIKAIFVCGEPIERQIEDSTLTCLVLPTKNIYLPHINLLAQVKMKIGHILAEKVASTAARGDHSQWLHALRHLESALKLCRAAATKKLDMEAELLFQIGKVERQITETGNNKSSQAVETLLEAINLSQKHDQKYELIRRAYLEIALLYLYFATDNEDVSQTDKLVPSKSSTSSGELSSEEAVKSEVYKVKAWIAIRAATQVSKAVLASQLLIGMKSVKEQSMKDEVQQKIPEFASMDLFSSYRDFVSVPGGYNVVSESTEASSAGNKQFMEDKQSESEGTESPVSKASQKKDTITWVHIIRYHNHLKRIYNTNLSGPGSLSARDGHLSSISDTGIVLRIAEMHSFLEKNLVEYSMCCLENFPEELHDTEMPLSSPAGSSEVSPEVTEITSEVSQVRIASPVSVIAEEDRQTESRAASASNKEINIQWYIPSVAKPSNDTETKVLLLYAYNTNPVKISTIKIFSSMSVFSGHLWIPLARIISLREKLSDLKEQVEILMQGSKSFSTSVPTSFPQQSETLKISPSNKPKMSDVKVDLDEKTEEIAKRCLSEVRALLSVVPALSPPLTKIPFDVTLQSITNLEDMFDLANGCIITEGTLFSWIISLLH